MYELSFPRPTDSSRHIAGLVTVTFDDSERVTFAQIGSTFYVRDTELGIWDRAYMIYVADGYLTYMRNPEVYTGTSSMKIHRSRVAFEKQSTLESATALLAPALQQAFRIDPPQPRFLVTEDGSVRAIALMWEQLGLRTHSTATAASDGRWESVRAVPVSEAQSRHVEVVIGTEAPRGAVILTSDQGRTTLDGRVVTDILECRRAQPLRLRYEDGEEVAFAAVVDARDQVSSAERLELPRRLTRLVAAIDEGVTSRYIEQVAYLADRHLRGDTEIRVTHGRVETWLRDPEEVARRASTDVVAATEYVVRTLEDQRQADERLSRDMFEGHDPFLELSEGEKQEMGLI